MTKKRGSVAALAILLACAPNSPARPGKNGDVPPPDPVNLDIPLDETPDAEEIQERQDAGEAARHPEHFHDLVLKLKPEHKQLEDSETPPIQNPQDFLARHPKDQATLAEETLAAQAILQPTAPPVVSTHPN